MLPERDIAYLADAWPDHRLHEHGGQVAVVLPDFAMPGGFTPRVVELLLLIPFGYPDTPLDMFWISPAVALHGASPQATCDDVHLGRTWQRFSRHLPSGVWKSGIDGLQSYLALVATMMRREAGPEANAA